MAKIKILKNVAINGKVHKKDTVVDLPAKIAGVLLDGEFAAPHEEPRQQQQQQQQQPPPPGGGQG